MRMLDRLTYANVTATIALFLALTGGVVYAADKIGSKDIAKNAVKSKQIDSGAVKSKEIQDGEVRPRDLAADVAVDSARTAGEATTARTAGTSRCGWWARPATRGSRAAGRTTAARTHRRASIGTSSASSTFRAPVDPPNSASTVFTLPAGYRPPPTFNRHTFGAMADFDEIVTVRLWYNGRVDVGQAHDTIVSLEGISFRAAP